MNTPEKTSEQKLYASVLEKGMYLGLLLLFISYLLYITGIISPYIPMKDLPHCWNLSVHEYVVENDIPTGWHWVTYLKYGDILNFTGIALLAGVTIVCFLSIVPLLARNKDYIYMIFALVQALILITAASGWLKVGH